MFQLSGFYYKPSRFTAFGLGRLVSRFRVAGSGVGFRVKV